MQKVQINIQPKHVALALTAVVLMAIATYALFVFALRGSLNIASSEFAAFFNWAAGTAKVATLSLPRCSSAIEHLSSGDSRREATMIYVARVVDLYRTTFGRLPENITDLDKLPTFENADKLNGDEMKRTCSIQQILSNRAYVLTCGGKLPAGERLDSTLGKTADERFAIVDGTEVLHVPLSRGCI